MDVNIKLLGVIAAMSQEMSWFKFVDMPVLVRRSAFFGSLLLLIVLIIAAVSLSRLTVLDAILAAIIGVILHWIGVMVHNYGHFFTAKRLGYPSIGVILYLVLGRITYPRDENELPLQIHLRRALGGPLFSLLLAIIATFLAALWMIPAGGIARFVGYWMVLDYWLVFTIAALVPPLRFSWFTNDGGTLWNLLDQSRAQNRQIS
jgi:hypothetical protein